MSCANSFCGLWYWGIRKMLLKDGKPAPQMLVEALEKDIYALKVFMAMSETFQKLYVNQIKNAQFGDSMRERVERTIRDIYKYGADNEI